jgi:5-methylcytosine-specific restriction endonuclease McrA
MAIKPRKKSGFARKMDRVVWAYTNRVNRAAKKGVEENFTPYQRQAVMMQFKKRCFRCGSAGPLHIDHHMPLSYGYALDYGNAVVLCAKCNEAKSNILPAIFYDPYELEVLNELLARQKKWQLR